MTDPWYGKQMQSKESQNFLAERATGVLSLSRGGRAYGIPMSFAWDSEAERAVMDFGFGKESKKRDFVETSEEACLTVYKWQSPQHWRSVIVTGTLSALDEDEIDENTAGWYDEVAKDIDISGGEIELAWYELVAENISGVALYE